MTAPASAGSAGAVFYRFENAEGRLEIVDSLGAVPEPLRARAERIELVPEPKAGVEVAATPVSAPALDWPSFGIGFGSATLLALSLLVLRGRRSVARIALSLGLAAAVAALLCAIYLGSLRRATGQSDSALGTPAEILDDARKAVEKAEDRRERQKRLLDEIEREAEGN